MFFYLDDNQWHVARNNQSLDFHLLRANYNIFAHRNLLKYLGTSSLKPPWKSVNKLLRGFSFSNVERFAASE